METLVVNAENYQFYLHHVTIVMMYLYLLRICIFPLIWTRSLMLKHQIWSKTILSKITIQKILDIYVFC